MKQKLGVALAAVAVAGAGALYVGNQLSEESLLDDDALIVDAPHAGESGLISPDMLDRHEFGHGPNGEPMPLDEFMNGFLQSDPSCKPAAEIADKYKKEGYKGLAYGYSETGTFFILTDAANKKWALVTPDIVNPANACVEHEGDSFETAQPTGRLLYASAPAETSGARFIPAVYMPVSQISQEDGLIGPDGRLDTKRLLELFNSKLEQSTVFKGQEKDGKTLRILSTKSDVPVWTMISSTPDGKGEFEGIGQGFSFAQNFKPPMKHLE
jgi:hypothetical protein